MRAIGLLYDEITIKIGERASTFVLLYRRRNTKAATEISRAPRKRGRGAVPPVRVEKTVAVQYRSIDLEEMAAASRNWKPCRERVGKLLPGMSVLAY